MAHFGAVATVRTVLVAVAVVVVVVVAAAVVVRATWSQSLVYSSY